MAYKDPNDIGIAIRKPSKKPTLVLQKKLKRRKRVVDQYSSPTTVPTTYGDTPYKSTPLKKRKIR